MIARCIDTNYVLKELGDFNKLNMCFSVDIVCSASGFPTPSYTWFRDLGETLFEFPDERVNLQDGSKAVLTLPSNATISSRRYKCRATNQYGEAYKVFVIYEMEIPTKPSEVKKSLF